MLKDFNGIREETATRDWPSQKVDRTKCSLRETEMWGNQNKTVPAGSGRYQDGRTGLRPGKKSKTKNIGRQMRLSTPVRTKHKCWRRICGLGGGLSKL